ncbi:MAG TPA: toxin glutamine deamidase domain-containing protein, partial [Cryptosporangiaceae bacterium]|nr:toxin glutamine deamidase domain-containing protein [Cryptosporangiaceae bacterium]
MPESRPSIDPAFVPYLELLRTGSETAAGTNSHAMPPRLVDAATTDPATNPDAAVPIVQAALDLANSVVRGVLDKFSSNTKRNQHLPKMAAALLTRNRLTGEAVITTHTSTRTGGSKHAKVEPTRHWMAQEVLDAVEADLKARGIKKENAHGWCAEVVLISDQLFKLDRLHAPRAFEIAKTHEGSTAELEAAVRADFRQFALDWLRDGLIATRQIRSEAEAHAVPRAPCRSCSPFLDAFGVTPIHSWDSAGDVASIPGSPEGAPSKAGERKPLVDSRPIGVPGGLEPVLQDDPDQLAFAAALPPKNPDGTRPAPHPLVGEWIRLVNDGGPTVPGRSNNCSDVALSVEHAARGDEEQMAAARTADVDPVTGERSTRGETNGAYRVESVLGTTFQWGGPDPAAAMVQLAQRVREAGKIEVEERPLDGPDATAVYVVSYKPEFGGGSHTLNVLNYDGTLYWVDGQTGQISATPPSPEKIAGVWSIVRDAGGTPVVDEVSGAAPVVPASPAAGQPGSPVERLRAQLERLRLALGMGQTTERAQQGVDRATPQDPDGNPVRHPDPRLDLPHPWLQQVNPGGTSVPGRADNKLDRALSFVASWLGAPTASAPVPLGVDGEPLVGPDTNSLSRAAEALGGWPQYGGDHGPAAMEAVRRQVAVEPGRSAVVFGTVDGNQQIWNVVNHDGTIVWVDTGDGTWSYSPPGVDPAEVSVTDETHEPVAGVVYHVWSTVLDPYGAPVVAPQRDLAHPPTSEDLHELRDHLRAKLTWVNELERVTLELGPDEAGAVRDALRVESEEVARLDATLDEWVQIAADVDKAVEFAGDFEEVVAELPVIHQELAVALAERTALDGPAGTSPDADRVRTLNTQIRDHLVNAAAGNAVLTQALEDEIAHLEALAGRYRQHGPQSPGDAARIEGLNTEIGALLAETREAYDRLLDTIPSLTGEQARDATDSRARRDEMYEQLASVTEKLQRLLDARAELLAVRGVNVTASAILDTDFRGDAVSEARPQLVMEEIARQMHRVRWAAGMVSITRQADGSYLVEQPFGEPFIVTVVAGHLAATDTGTPVARSRIDRSGPQVRVEIVVSDRARLQDVGRGLSHELSEVAAVLGRASGERLTVPSDHLRGRLAEVRYLANRLSSDPSDVAADQDLDQLLEHLGFSPADRPLVLAFAERLSRHDVALGHVRTLQAPEPRTRSRVAFRAAHRQAVYGRAFQDVREAADDVSTELARAWEDLAGLADQSRAADQSRPADPDGPRADQAEGTMLRQQIADQLVEVTTAQDHLAERVAAAEDARRADPTGPPVRRLADLDEARRAELERQSQEYFRALAEREEHLQAWFDNVKALDAALRVLREETATGATADRLADLRTEVAQALRAAEDAATKPSPSGVTIADAAQLDDADTSKDGDADLLERAAEMVGAADLVQSGLRSISRTYWSYQNGDVGRLVTADDPVVQESQIPGHDVDAVDRQRDHDGRHSRYRRPLLAHQRLLELALLDAFGVIPRTPDPRVGTWLRAINAFGLDLDSTRRVNCVDARMAFLETYLHGRPRVAAPVQRNTFGDRTAEAVTPVVIDTIEELVTGGETQSVVSRRDGVDRSVVEQQVDAGYAAIEAHLESLGHGAVALIDTAWVDGESHAWAAVNQDGKILWVDPQDGLVQDSPIFPSSRIDELDVLFLDGDAKPEPAPSEAFPAGATQPGVLQPASSRRGSAPRTEVAPTEQEPEPDPVEIERRRAEAEIVSAEGLAQRSQQAADEAHRLDARARMVQANAETLNGQLDELRSRLEQAQLAQSRVDAEPTGPLDLQVELDNVTEQVRVLEQQVSAQQAQAEELSEQIAEAATRRDDLVGKRTALEEQMPSTGGEVAAARVEQLGALIEQRDQRIASTEEDARWLRSTAEQLSGYLTELGAQLNQVTGGDDASRAALAAAFDHVSERTVADAGDQVSDRTDDTTAPGRASDRTVLTAPYATKADELTHRAQAATQEAHSLRTAAQRLQQVGRARRTNAPQVADRAALIALEELANDFRNTVFGLRHRIRLELGTLSQPGVDADR